MQRNNDRNESSSSDETPKATEAPKRDEKLGTADPRTQERAKQQIAAESESKKASPYTVGYGPKEKQKSIICIRGAVVSGQPVTVMDFSRSSRPEDLARGQARLDALVEEGHVVKSRV